MPRASTAAGKKATPSTASAQKDKKKPAVDKFEFYDDDENQDDIAGSSRDETPATAPKAGKKRFYEEVDDDEGPPLQVNTNMDGEMQTMLESFGADVRKSMVSKRKRLESLTQQSLKSANTKVEKIWKVQQSERSHLQDEHTKQLRSVLEQWENDVVKVKDQEEKIQTIFRQQQKLFQQSLITMTQRLKSVRQLFDQYSKTVGELEQCHTDQQSHVQGELRKEMGMLQKKILMDTQNQEMANVRKSLQTMFF